MMDKNEIIEHLREIAKRAVHTIGEKPFIMSLDDGIAVHEAIEIIQQSQPERKKGKWIVHYECPKCGEITKDFTEYCPFCGAPMVDEEAM